MRGLNIDGLRLYTEPSSTNPVREEGRKDDLESASIHEGEDLDRLGYRQELLRNRSVITLLFQTLAIAAIPYGEGSALLNAIYGGGPLSIFIGWIAVCILDECVALSLAELASRYPTSAGPYYWSFQISGSSKTLVSFIHGWVWLIGNWTIALSVNFANSWQLLLILYAVCLGSLLNCTFVNRYLPQVNIICASWTAATIIVILIALSVKADAGRHSASYVLAHYHRTLSSWGDFTFFIGLLPPSYTFSAIGMVSSMAEECAKLAIKVPQAISLCVPVGGLSGLLFIFPICITLPSLESILNAPAGQALPFIFHHVMGSPGGGLALTFLVLVITLFCPVSITVAASRTTWAFARDDAIPLASLWSHIHPRLGVPVNALLLTIIQMLLGLINLGSSSAFTAFVSVGVIALAVAYSIPISLSLAQRPREVSKAHFCCGRFLGPLVNALALCWISFELVLFSMPTALLASKSSMNYASVMFAGFLAISGFWYAVYARKSYKGPPESDGL